MARNLRSWWHRWLSRYSHTSKRTNPWHKRPMLEALEDRYLLSAYVVTTTADSGTGSLRDAITQVNAGSYNEIDFAIGAQGSAQTITPLSILPAITANDVFLNGLSQGGSGNTTQLITLNGANAGFPNIDGLQLNGTGCVLSGMMVEGYHGNDVDVHGKNNTIGGTSAGAGNIFLSATEAGVNVGASGVMVQGNTIEECGYGINVGSSINTIGGTTVASRNAIYDDQVDIRIPASRVLVEGNYVGTDASGNYDDEPHSDVGIEISGSNDTIGGTSAAARNLISDIYRGGILLEGSSSSASVSGALIQGNYIGTDYTGTEVVGDGDGVEISSYVSSATIGGTVAGSRNIISGNSGDGIAFDTSYTGGSGVVVQGNYIGTDVTGTKPLHDQNGLVFSNSAGIAIEAPDVVIGGTTPGARNIISANFSVDVSLGSSGATLLGNYIGTDVSGLLSLEYNQNGVQNIGIEISGPNNTIGSTLWAARNIISGNANDGVVIESGATGNLLLGNMIGVNANDSAALANMNGIEVKSAGNTIGGTAPGARNVISGNSNDGVLFDGTGATGNLVQGSFIGLDSAGDALGNNNGIEDSSGNNTIGGNVSGARNYISGNLYDGILLDSGASASVVQGDYIGTNAAGAGASGNRNGIEIAGVSNTIGSTVWSARNVVSGNSDDGILIDSTGKNNLVQGNILGANANNSGALPNNNGIELAGVNNTIGGTSWADDHDVISGNSKDGVLIDASAMDNALLNNLIGLSTALAGLGNGAYGVSIAGSYVHEAGNYIADNASGGVLVSQGSSDTIQDIMYTNGPSGRGAGIILDSGTNDGVGAPVLNSASASGTTLTVSGSFNAPTTGGTYLVYFFANPSNDAEGAIYLGRLSVSPTSTGVQSFTFTTTTSVTAIDPVITATLTDNIDDTSTFSSGVITT